MVNQVSAETNRRRIPDRYAVTFVEMTNDELASMATDSKLRSEVRAFALWEMEFREAAGIEVYYDADTDSIRRRRA